MVFCGRSSWTWIPASQLPQEMHWEWYQKVPSSFSPGSCNLNELWVTDRRGHFVPFRPLRASGSTEYLHDLIHGLYLVLPRKNGCHQVQFHHNRGQRKDIHRWAISPMQQQLRCSIPPCWNVLSIRRPGPDLSRQPEITDLDIVVMTQYVLRFEIPVKVPKLMQVGESGGDFEEDGLDLIFC